MSKFMIECPSCGRFTEASTGLFAKRSIPCVCGNTINVKTDKMTSRVCAHCGNNVIFDLSKGSNAVCPVCHEKINTTETMINMVEFHCPSCSCGLSADRNAAEYTCPLCDTVIDVQREVKRQEERKKGLASVIKYEGDNQTFVWKHPIEDFNLGSQLIVHESQEALFFRDGQALDLFGAGGGLGEIAGLGVSLGAIGGVMGLTREAMSPLTEQARGMGRAVSGGMSPEGWECECGARGITSKFCPECGKPKPVPASGWDCPECGTKNISSRFCPECGEKKPEGPETWICPDCGTKDITTKFCPNCGAKKGE